MATLDIEVRPDWIVRKLTINGKEYEELENRNGSCNNSIAKQLIREYPSISESDLELIEQVLCADVDDAQDALEDLEDYFETF